MNVRMCRVIHLVGAGGINVSAVAKLLHRGTWNVEQEAVNDEKRTVRVTGSDLHENEQTELLAKMGIAITIGHSVSNVPVDCDVLVYSSAVPPSNPEREEARRRGIREMTNFEFLGEWFHEHRTIIVAGTHGKSTTTAMLGLILERAGLDPTVIVGSVVPSFPDGNLRIGKSDLVVVEGDEYAKHFLAFRPHGLVINNLELDHTDIFPTIEDMKAAFRELIDRVVDGGFIVANLEDANVRQMIHPLPALPLRKGEGEGRGWRLQIPGRFNQMNASGAATAARELGVSEEAIAIALESFKGIWRRFEFLGEKNGAKIYSDYAHHPTAVAATLEAAQVGVGATYESPGQMLAKKIKRRVLLCFQPHHRNRTKHFFFEFVSSFDRADVLVLCEIYDVAGRDASADADVSSQDLVDATIRHDMDRGVTRSVEYAPTPDAAVRRTLELAQPGDCVLIMGAGDIDAEARMAILR